MFEQMFTPEQNRCAILAVSCWQLALGKNQKPKAKRHLTTASGPVGCRAFGRTAAKTCGLHGCPRLHQ